MIAQGVRPDDPDVIKLKNVLAAYQRNAQFNKQRDSYLQQQALQRQQQQHAADSNGVNGMYQRRTIGN